MFVLLPPSEGKASGGSGGWSPDDGRFGKALGPARRTVVDALVDDIGHGDAARRSKLLGVKGANLTDAVDDTLALPAGPPALKATERYTGVVWSHLDPAGLPTPGRAWTRKHVVVVSGLLGLVGANDPVPAYRCKMSIAPGGLGKLSRWWRPHLDAALGTKPVVDLLPNEHADAVPPRGSHWLTVRFETESGTAAGHHGKAGKGLFTRHLALHQPGSIADIIDIGSTFDGAAGVETTPTDTGWEMIVVLSDAR